MNNYALYNFLSTTDGGSPQSGGNQGTLSGTVLDATGAVVIGATVKIHNPVSGLDRSTQTNTTRWIQH
jgi:NAD+--asparagine ADP-ribosyltransferase